MRLLLCLLLALGLLTLPSCASDCADGSCNEGTNPTLGVSPVVPSQIEGGKGWR